ncbi:MAG TPA: hypothetical protein VJK71_02105 [Gemmatimonadales bacterium]|nr:hypothetical protein [Gemmatimonadales bacterium]
MIQPSKESEAELISKEHLIRVLSEQIERTFSSEGQSAALKLVGDLLRGLDASALRELAYQQGLTTEFDLEPDQAEE